MSFFGNSFQIKIVKKNAYLCRFGKDVAKIFHVTIAERECLRA